MGHGLIPLVGSTSYVQLIIPIMVESDRHTCVITGQQWLNPDPASSDQLEIAEKPAVHTPKYLSRCHLIKLLEEPHDRLEIRAIRSKPRSF